MLVAITGATGFIGQRLVSEHLRRGDRVRILTRRSEPPALSGVEAVVGDLTSDALPQAFPGDADILYHCAAELRKPACMQAVNLDGTRRLAEAAAGRIGRWVQLSSVGVYGPHREGEITEDMPLAPVNGYEISKARGDEAVLKIAAGGGFACSLLRPSIVFGPGMPNRSLVQLAALIRRGLFFYVGPPGASANYIPADNVVDALLLCATHPAAVGRTYNLSDWATMEDFVAAIAGTLGVSLPRLRMPLGPVRALAALAAWVPGSPLTPARVAALSGRSRYSTRRIEAELGYRNRTDLAAALRATLASAAGEATL